MRKKILSIILASLIILSVMPLSIFASASTISDKSSFNVSVTQLDKSAQEYAGCLKVQLSCKSDAKTLVTTLGCAVVVDTKTIDTIDYNTESVTTSSYLSEAVQFGSTMAMEALQFGSGKRKSSFSGFETLSMCSYNSSSKELYMFICGMQPGGIVIPEEETPIVNLYLKIKEGKKFTKNSIRLMKVSEFEDTSKCPSKAVYPAEISSTTEVADICKNVTLNIDKSLIGSASVETTTNSAKTTTKAMTDSQITDAIIQEIGNPIKPTTDEEKSSSAYIKYETALEKAKTVLNDSSSSASQKKEVLEELKSAKEAYNKEFGKSDNAESNNAQKNSSNIWLYIVIAVAVVAIVVVVIVVVSKKKKKEIKGNKETAE